MLLPVPNLDKRGCLQVRLTEQRICLRLRRLTWRCSSKERLSCEEKKKRKRKEEGNGKKEDEEKKGRKKELRDEDDTILT